MVFAAHFTGGRLGGFLWGIATWMKWVPAPLWFVLPARARGWGLVVPAHQRAAVARAAAAHDPPAPGAVRVRRAAVPRRLPRVHLGGRAVVVAARRPVRVPPPPRVGGGGDVPGGAAGALDAGVPRRAGRRSRAPRCGRAMPRRVGTSGWTHRRPVRSRAPRRSARSPPTRPSDGQAAAAAGAGAPPPRRGSITGRSSTAGDEEQHHPDEERRTGYPSRRRPDATASSTSPPMRGSEQRRRAPVATLLMPMYRPAEARGMMSVMSAQSTARKMPFAAPNSVPPMIATGTDGASAAIARPGRADPAGRVDHAACARCGPRAATRARSPRRCRARPRRSGRGSSLPASSCAMPNAGCRYAVT